MKVLKEKIEVNGKTVTNQTIYYNMREAGIMVGKCYQAILDYTKYSDELEVEGKERLIPKPTLLKDKDGKKGVLHFTKDEVEEIKSFVKTLKRGDLLRFTQKNNKYIKLFKYIKTRHIKAMASN